MTKNLFVENENLPESGGVFCLYDKQKQPLHVGVAENVKHEIEKIVDAENSFLNLAKIARIELLNSESGDFIKLFAETIRRKKPLYNFSLAAEKLYPHLKLTKDKFPQFFVTRRIENDGAEYFGAFLPETGVRFLLDFLNRTFRLRNCTITVDGNFPLPCTQFYEKKCVAPCVRKLCNEKDYNESLNLVRWFLQNKRETVESFLFQKIQASAAVLDFETASGWRDRLLETQEIWHKKDFQWRLEDAVDSFEIEEKSNRIFIYLVTQRGRKVLGRRVFVFENSSFFSTESVLAQIIWQFYQFHAPKEIRVSIDFSSRKFLERVLSQREKRQIKINVVRQNNRKITIERAFGRTKFEFDFKQIKAVANFKDIQKELKKELKLKFLPRRIECFDVAHISGTNFVAAKVVWEDGQFLTHEDRYWLLDEKSELATLAKGIEKSLRANNKSPDLILIDGGKPQLSAALKIINQIQHRKFAVVGAVKPPRRHSEVAHFLNENAETFLMKTESGAMQLLVRLRDEAHDLANRIHRLQRDTMHFYEKADALSFLKAAEKNLLIENFGSIERIKQLARENFTRLFGNEKGERIFIELNRKDVGDSAAARSVIVPLRYDAPDGEAKDLQPLRLRHKKSL